MPFFVGAKLHQRTCFGLQFWKWTSFLNFTNMDLFFESKATSSLYFVWSSLLLLEGWVALVESSMSPSSCSVQGQPVLHPSYRHTAYLLALSAFNVEQHGQAPTTGVNVACLLLHAGAPTWRPHGAWAVRGLCDDATAHTIGARH
jgi:hypothetical protein